MAERPPSAHVGTQARVPPAEVVAGQKQYQSSDETQDLEILHPAPAPCVLPACFGEAGEPANALDLVVIGQRASPLMSLLMFPEDFVLDGSPPTGMCTGHLGGHVVSSVLVLPNSGGHELKKEVFSPAVFSWEQ